MSMSKLFADMDDTLTGDQAYEVIKKEVMKYQAKELELIDIERSKCCSTSTFEGGC